MLNVALYRSWEELLELRELWNPLLSRSASDTVFLTWQWVEAWWKNYGAGRPLFVLCAWEGQSLVGVAPLFVDSLRRYGTNWRPLRLIGDGSHDSDYLDFFAVRGREGEVVRTLVDHLKTRRDDWDWIELSGPVKDSPCVANLLNCIRQSAWEVRCEPIPCATLPLPKTWDDYLRLLDPRFRTKVRSALGLLKEQVKSDPEPCVSPEQLDEWLPILFDLHTRRWATANKPGVFRGTAKQSFYYDLSRSALAQDWLAFHRMHWGERTLAVQYGLLYRNRFHLLQEGYDPDFSSVRPGVALRAWLMRHWIESGVEEYDFLAGASGYKFEWGGQKKAATRLVILPTRVSRLVAVEGPILRRQAREKAGQLIPQPLMAFRQKLISQRARNACQSRVVAAPQTNDGRRTVRQAAAVAYSSTALGRLGNAIASTYYWDHEKNGTWLPFKTRLQPVCQIFHYHRVNDDADPFLGGLSVDAFRAQMEHLAANFPVLSLDQIARGEFPKERLYCVAITFDDGYRDNFVHALPILKRLGIPATIFLATGYVETGSLPWYDQVRLAFKLTRRSRLSLSASGGPSGELGDFLGRARFSETVLRWMRGLPERERKNAIPEVFHALRVPSELNLPNQMLRWEDIRQMAKQGMSFGAHTVTHPVLSRITGKQMEKEIMDSKSTIENRLQMPVEHFAYPFGQMQDYSLEAKQVVQEAGFKTAVTTVWGVNEAGSDLFELRRFAPWQSDPAEFKMKFDWYRFRELQSQPRPEQGVSTFRASGEVLLS